MAENTSGRSSVCSPQAYVSRLFAWHRSVAFFITELLFYCLKRLGVSAPGWKGKIPLRNHERGIPASSTAPKYHFMQHSYSLYTLKKICKRYSIFFFFFVIERWFGILLKDTVSPPRTFNTLLTVGLFSWNLKCILFLKENHVTKDEHTSFPLPLPLSSLEPASERLLILNPAEGRW